MDSTEPSAAKSCSCEPFYCRHTRLLVEFPPMKLRSMGRIEMRLRKLAGSGWRNHPTGWRWAQVALAFMERVAWH